MGSHCYLLYSHQQGPSIETTIKRHHSEGAAPSVIIQVPNIYDGNADACGGGLSAVVITATTAVGLRLVHRQPVTIGHGAVGIPFERAVDHVQLSV